MRTFDFTPYRRSTVGFDRLFDFLENASRGDAGGGDNYPPFDIEKSGDDRYAITLAIAGFRPEDIEVTQNQNLLIIKGQKRERSEDKGRQVIHTGIATRAFERRFELADFVRVEAADIKDGLLRLDLVREVPEAMKPRTIQVGGTQRSAEPQQIEGESRQASNEDHGRSEMAA